MLVTLVPGVRWMVSESRSHDAVSMHQHELPLVEQRTSLTQTCNIVCEADCGAAEDCCCGNTIRGVHRAARLEAFNKSTSACNGQTLEQAVG